MVMLVYKALAFSYILDINYYALVLGDSSRQLLHKSCNVIIAVLHIKFEAIIMWFEALKW